MNIRKWYHIFSRVNGHGSSSVRFCLKFRYQIGMYLITIFKERQLAQVHRTTACPEDRFVCMKEQQNTEKKMPFALEDRCGVYEVAP